MGAMVRLNPPSFPCGRPCDLPSPSILFSSVLGKCDPLKSVVAIFRINTLTPVLTVGSDVNQVYRPSTKIGVGEKELSGVGIQESVDSVVVHAGLHSR